MEDFNTLNAHQEQRQQLFRQHQQQQQQQQLFQQQQQQQFLLLQQLNRQQQQQQQQQQDAGAHFRPPQPPQHQHRPAASFQTPNSQIPNWAHTQNPNPNLNSAYNAVANANVNNNSNNHGAISQQQQNRASLQMAYQDAWSVCNPDCKRPFSSLVDACERLLPYHVVADYEAEEDDKILDSDMTGQMLSRSQQWDHNIAAKVAEFTATFEKQVLAFNMICRKREHGEFRTEEKVMMEKVLLQDENRAVLELRAEMESKKASRETHEANMRMAMFHAEQGWAGSQAHAEMIMQAPLRANAMHELEHQAGNEEMMHGWGGDMQRDEKEPFVDFLNDDETGNGGAMVQSQWDGGGKLDLNAK